MDHAFACDRMGEEKEIPVVYDAALEGEMAERESDAILNGLCNEDRYADLDPDEDSKGDDSPVPLAEDG